MVVLAIVASVLLYAADHNTVRMGSSACGREGVAPVEFKRHHYQGSGEVPQALSVAEANPD
jgi:hypothetical protein